MKDWLRNKLSTDHLGVAIGMYGQTLYTLENFPFNTYSRHGFILLSIIIMVSKLSFF
jgi:hypothetical protein